MNTRSWLCQRRRGWWPRRWLAVLTIVGIGCAIIVHLLGGVGLQAAPHRQVPIVAPDAVSTPVPTQPATPLLVATPFSNTPTPQDGHMLSQARVVTIKPGDTLWTLALETGLDLALMPCTVAPDFVPEQPLVIGNTLDVLPPDQWCHTIAPAETLASIGATYGVLPEQIYAIPWNGLQAVPIAAVALGVGHHLRIPLTPITASPRLNTVDGKAATEGEPSFLTWMLHQPVDTSPFAVLAVGGPFAEQVQQAAQLTNRALRPIDQPGVVPANWPYGSGTFMWPLAGWLTQGYRYDHRALDIAAPSGTVVTAADRGVVLRAGWNNQGYGFFVIIDHNIDYVTLYAHLSEVLVIEGQVVAQGQLIGKVGSTGNSTGPHLHFEIRDFGRLTNPLEHLVQ